MKYIIISQTQISHNGMPQVSSSHQPIMINNINSGYMSSSQQQFIPHVNNQAIHFAPGVQSSTAHEAVAPPGVATPHQISAPPQTNAASHRRVSPLRIPSPLCANAEPGVIEAVPSTLSEIENNPTPETGETSAERIHDSNTRRSQSDEASVSATAATNAAGGSVASSTSPTTQSGPRYHEGNRCRTTDVDHSSIISPMTSMLNTLISSKPFCDSDMPPGGDPTSPTTCSYAGPIIQSDMLFTKETLPEQTVPPNINKQLGVVISDLDENKMVFL